MKDSTPAHDVLMALRIPTGWSIRWNGLFEAEHPDCVDSEDLLWLEQINAATGTATGLFLDIGWYGSREQGTFRLVLLKGGWDHELKSFVSRDRFEIVRELERWLLSGFKEEAQSG